MLYRANKEKAKAYTRAWRKKHPEKAAEYWRESRRKNPDKKRQYSKDWRAKNRMKDRENSRRARKKNPEKAKAAVRDWAKRHPEKIRMYCRNRRALLIGAVGAFTNQQWVALKDKYNRKCLCCGKTELRLSKEALVLSPDHILPLSKGGSNNIDNIQPLCHGRYKGAVGGCNEKKGTKTIDYRGLLNASA